MIGIVITIECTCISLTYNRETEWVDDCCLTLFEHILVISLCEEVTLQFNDDVVCFVLYQHAIVLPHWNNIGLSSTQTYYSDSESCSLTHQCCVLNGDSVYTNCIVFVLTRPTLESTIYRIRVDYANHYTTDRGSNIQPYVFNYQDFLNICQRNYLLHANHYITDTVPWYHISGNASEIKRTSMCFHVRMIVVVERSFSLCWLYNILYSVLV